MCTLDNIEDSLVIKTNATQKTINSKYQNRKGTVICKISSQSITTKKQQSCDNRECWLISIVIIYNRYMLT